LNDNDQRSTAAAGHDPALDVAFDWILDLKASPTDRDLRNAFEAWLAVPAHAAAYREAEEVWELTALAPRAQPSLRLPPPIRSRAGRRALPWVGAALAASIACVALPGLRLALQADYRTDPAETRAVTLPDGSTMTLDGDSAAALDDGGKTRGVDLLAGRAYFEVAKNAQRAFVVSAGEVEVTVHGTAFDVLLSEKTVSVAVAEGSVSVEAVGQGANLHPGERALVDLVTGRITTDRVAPGSIAAWREGQLIVNGATIGEIIGELRRYHRGMIILPESSFAARRVAGIFDLRDPSAALQGLARAYGGHVVALTPYILVVKAD